MIGTLSVSTIFTLSTYIDIHVLSNPYILRLIAFIKPDFAYSLLLDFLPKALVPYVVYRVCSGLLPKAVFSKKTLYLLDDSYRWNWRVCAWACLFCMLQVGRNLFEHLHFYSWRVVGVAICTSSLMLPGIYAYALWEEVIFRNLMWRRMQAHNVHNVGAYFLIGSVAFSLIHFIYMNPNTLTHPVDSFVYYFSKGIVLSTIVYLTGGLEVATVNHTKHNFLVELDIHLRSLAQGSAKYVYTAWNPWYRKLYYFIQHMRKFDDVLSLVFAGLLVWCTQAVSSNGIHKTYRSALQRMDVICLLAMCSWPIVHTNCGPLVSGLYIFTTVFAFLRYSSLAKQSIPSLPIQSSGVHSTAILPNSTMSSNLNSSMKLDSGHQKWRYVLFGLDPDDNNKMTVDNIKVGEQHGQFQGV